jgi:hypothetical protein
VVPKDSAKIGPEKFVALNGDHLQITKFEDPGDQNYRSVQGHLRYLIDNIRIERGTIHLDAAQGLGDLAAVIAKFRLAEGNPDPSAHNNM